MQKIFCDMCLKHSMLRLLSTIETSKEEGDRPNSYSVCRSLLGKNRGSFE